MTTTPQRFTKRPVTIEAAQLTDDAAQWHDIYLWVEANTLGSFEPLDVIEGRKPWPPSGVSIDPRDGLLIISTLEGLHWADEGDWIIRGVQGEFYPCKDAIFRETYEPATEHVKGEQDDPADAEIMAAAAAIARCTSPSKSWWELSLWQRESYTRRAIEALTAAREARSNID